VLAFSTAGPTLSAGPPGAVEAAAAAAAPEYIFDVTDEDFMQKVLAPEQHTPILLDCHAEWCGPCKELTPLLESIVTSYGGGVLLAKMDVDQAPQVAAQMQIKAIPLVAGFKHATMPDGRQGMSIAGVLQGDQLSEKGLREFIEEKLGVAAPAATPEQQVAAAAAVLEEGDAPKAMELFNSALTAAADAEQEDQQAEATAGLLRCYMAMLGDEPQAKLAADTVVKALKEAPLAAHSSRPAVAQALAAHALLGEEGEESPAEVAARAAEGDLGARLQMAKMEFAGGSHEKGLEEALAVLKADAAFDDEAARKLLLTFFEALGGENPLVSRYRRRMSSLLFV